MHTSRRTFWLRFVTWVNKQLASIQSGSVVLIPKGTCHLKAATNKILHSSLYFASLSLPILSFVFPNPELVHLWCPQGFSLPISCASQNRQLLDAEIVMFRELSCTLPTLWALPAQWMSKIPQLYWFLLALPKVWEGQRGEGRTAFDSLDYSQNLFNFQNFPRVYLTNSFLLFNIITYFKAN